MNNPLNQFKESARDIRLSRAAYARMREKLVAHMSVHPLPPVRSPYQRFFGMLSPFISNLKRPVAVLAVLALVAVGGAATYAAEGSLPGDPLYPLKVKVIEPVQGFLAVTPEAKAQWRASIANTRLFEVEQLAAQGKLTPEESAKSDERFVHSLQAAQATIQDLSQKNPQAAARVKASLTESLGEHQTALDALGVSATSSDAAQVRKFVGHVKNEIQSTLSGSATTTPEEDAPQPDKNGQDGGLPSGLQSQVQHSVRGGSDDGSVFGGFEIDR